MNSTLLTICLQCHASQGDDCPKLPARKRNACHRYLQGQCVVSAMYSSRTTRIGECENKIWAKAEEKLTLIGVAQEKAVLLRECDSPVP